MLESDPRQFLVSERDHGWISHALGLEKLFELRGPESFTSPPARWILEKTRSSIIFAALVLRQPTILGRSDWKTVPWSLSPDHKDPLQYLFDILSDCPDLVVIKDKVNSNMTSEDTISECQVLLERAQKLLEELRQWKQVWILLHPHCSHECPPSTTVPYVTDAQGQIIPAWLVVFQYQSLYHANAMVVYHATRILLLKLINDFAALSSEFETKGQYFSQNIFSAGIAICQSVDYYLESTRGELGGVSLLFPLRMAFDAVGPHNPEIRAWLKAVLHQISSGSVTRWGAAKHLLEIK